MLSQIHQITAVFAKVLVHIFHIGFAVFFWNIDGNRSGKSAAVYAAGSAAFMKKQFSECKCGRKILMTGGRGKITILQPFP